MNAHACIYVTCLGSEIVCVSDLLIAASFFARARLSANLFSADETDLYGEVSGLNFARCFVS